MEACDLVFFPVKREDPFHGLGDRLMAWAKRVAEKGSRRDQEILRQANLRRGR